MKKAITDFTIGAVAMLSVVGLYSAVDLWQRTGMDCPKLKPGHARKGWEYYTENRIWHPDADINMEGLQIAMQVYGEQFQAKGPLPSPARYVDQSYLKEALRELGGR